MWSERLAPAYFSKGSGVAFAIRASTMIFGANEFGVRFFSPLLGAGTSLLLFYLGRRMFNASAALGAVIGLNATPIFNLGAFLMTIDPLSLFFWVAAMFSFWCVVEKSPKLSWHWPLTGVLIGLGFLCKYTNVFELVSIIVILALIPKLRGDFRRPGLPVMLLLLHFIHFSRSRRPPHRIGTRSLFPVLDCLRPPSGSRICKQSRFRDLSPVAPSAWG